MAHVIEMNDSQHPLLADFANLTDVALRKKLDPARGLYLAESTKVIERALSVGHIPNAAITGPKTLESTLRLLSGFDVPVFSASESVVEALTGFHLHRGAIASMNRPELPSVAAVVSDARLIVILENLVDHTNVGAVFRSVAALGADAVLITQSCADPLYRRSIRVSMGAVLQVPWTRLQAWPKDATILQNAGFHLAALALDDSAVDVKAFAERKPDRVALVLGTEGTGLSRRTLNAADSVVRIPMQSGVDSLNVATAAAVALFALS